MFEKKYIIIIAIIICLLVLYYFYDEISSVKKLFVPTYQKTMALEARIINLEKKTSDPAPKKKLLNSKIDSPALSITYQSDMVKNGNLSVKYTDISDTEAKELLKKIDHCKSKQQVAKQIPSIPMGELSEPNNSQNKNIFMPNTKKPDFDIEESDTINIKVADLVQKNSQTAEYEKILDGLTKNISNIRSEDVFDDDELDADIIKSISESIQYADMPSENTLSDIPSTPKVKKPKNVNKKIKKSLIKKATSNRKY